MALVVKLILFFVVIVGYIAVLVVVFRSAKRDTDAREGIAAALEKIADKLR